MLGQMRHWHVSVIALLSAIVSPRLTAQTRTADADSVQLRHLRIRAQGTNACHVHVSTSSSLNIDTDVSPANVRRWIDTATAYAAAKPHRVKGHSVRYAWITLRLGVVRTVTAHSDSYAFVIGGTAIPITAREIPRIAKLLESAAAETLKQSTVKGGCPTTPDT
jgi:hypothetical protein